MSDPREPVVVGVAQLTRRQGAYEDVRDALEPAALMAEVVRAAAADSGAPGLAEAIDSTWVAQPMSRRYPDPGLLVNRRLGIGARSIRAVLGGNSPQLMVNEASAAIAEGRSDVAVVVGAEAMYSRFRARREGVTLPWETSDAPPCPEEVGDTRHGTDDVEERHGAAVPIEIYPLIETALRGALGRSVAEHQAALGRLWSGFSAVASANPHAWTRERFDASDIAEPAPDNRVVTFPYTKRMCANLAVDMAAAVVLTSRERADAAGVADDRRVFPLGGADAHDHFLVSERRDLADSPAIRVLAAELAGATGAGVDDVARFDLYSCFPSAVQVAAGALGLDLDGDRPLTLTGGLPLFGGPGNNYVTHSIVETVEACRREPGSIGMVTGVGWYLTKHSAGLYSTDPPAGGFRRVDPRATQAKVDALPKRDRVDEFDGVAVVESTAVVHERDGTPARVTATLLTGEGNRVIARSDDADVAAAVVAESWEGKRVGVSPESGVNRLRPDRV